MSDINQPYDPSAPEGEVPRGNAYVSKRDVKIILAVIGVLGLALYPVYKNMQKDGEKARCAQNMKAISTALNEYATLHDDRFPPVMRTAVNGSPDLGESGMAYTWASDIDEHMNPRASFLCPSAKPNEVTFIEGPQGKRIPITYGMYAPYGGFLRSLIENPDQTLVVAETSNFGSQGSYDPTKYADGKGQPIMSDGFVIGWNNSNLAPSESSKYVTRLAFPGTKDGVFAKDGLARHDLGIHALTATGAAAPLLKPHDAEITLKFGLPGGMWAAPPVSGSRTKRP